VKKIINDPANVVAESLRGLAAAHADILRVQSDPDVVVRADAPVAGKVAVISGGGSGHEPLHGGFVGLGMLAAAVPGAVFTSPTPDAVQAAVTATTGDAGALLIVKNYTGDVLNFETAAELAAADGLEVRSVVIDDDVAVKDSTYTAGRRGVGGTVLLEKITGAAAERGDSLDAVTALAQKVIGQVRSIGRERIPLEPADALVARLVQAVVEDLPFESGDRVLLFTNSMGGTPLVELYLAHGIAERLLAERGIVVERRLVGPYITSLEMQGMSLTLLKLDDELTELWDAPVNTAALRWGV
jgi:dihydroxyacetone kinase-like protein